MDLNIAYDREDSTEIDSKYFVYESEGLRPVIYKGTYPQCLCVIGAFHLDPDITIAEIRSKSNGFI